MFEERRYSKEQPPSSCYWFEVDLSKGSRGSKYDIQLDGGIFYFSGVGLRLFVDEGALSIDEIFLRENSQYGRVSVTNVPISADLFIIDNLQEPDCVGRIVLPYIHLVTGVFGKNRPLTIILEVRRPGVFKGYFSGEWISRPEWVST